MRSFSDSKVRTRVVALLLLCGIVASAIYIATDISAAYQWEEYRYADRSVSELLALDAPTRSFVVPPMLAYNALMLAFGVGVIAAGDKRSLRATGFVLLAYAIVSMLGLTVFQLKPGSPTADGSLSVSGLLHTMDTAAQVLLMFAFILLGSGVRGRGFRWYSIATFLIVLVGGAWAGSRIAVLASGQASPGVGLIERANIYSMMLWVAAFAVALWQRYRELRLVEGDTSAREAPALTRARTAGPAAG